MNLLSNQQVWVVVTVVLVAHVAPRSGVTHQLLEGSAAPSVNRSPEISPEQGSCSMKTLAALAQGFPKTLSVFTPPLGLVS